MEKEKKSGNPLCMKPTGKKMSFPPTSHPITAYCTEYSLLHISVKQQDRLHSEFRDVTSFFFVEPLG